MSAQESKASQIQFLQEYFGGERQLPWSFLASKAGQAAMKAWRRGTDSKEASSAAAAPDRAQVQGDRVGEARSPPSSCAAVAADGRQGLRRHFRVAVGNPHEVAPWLQSEGERRAPHYLEMAVKFYKDALKLLQVGNAGHAVTHLRMQAMLQIVGALDLAASSTTIWMRAGKITLALAELDEQDAQNMVEDAVSLFAEACRQEPRLIKDIRRWLKNGRDQVSDSDPVAIKDLRGAARTAMRSWKVNGLPEVPSTVFWKDDSVNCHSTGKTSDALPTSGSGSVDADLVAVTRNFGSRTLFATHVLHGNVASEFTPGWCDRLARVSIDRFSSFSAESRRNHGPLTEQQLNNGFFFWQVKDEVGLSIPEHQQKWPELYTDSRDFHILKRVVKASLLEYASRLGLTAPQFADTSEYVATFWANVYPGVSSGGVGGRLGFHTHPWSLASCVLYLQTDPSPSSPIIFVDPRGANPMDDWERDKTEYDVQPLAPFHQGEHFFPDIGDIFCFPSWLVHLVPTQRSNATRVAFAANLQARRHWDAWFRTATAV